MLSQEQFRSYIEYLKNRVPSDEEHKDIWQHISQAIEDNVSENFEVHLPAARVALVLGLGPQ